MSDLKLHVRTCRVGFSEQDYNTIGNPCPRLTNGIAPSSKGSHPSSEETIYRKGRDLCQLTPDRELISKIYKELQKINTIPTPSPISKWSYELNRQFSTKKYKCLINILKHVQHS